jgi:hypothetical protein
MALHFLDLGAWLLGFRDRRCDIFRVISLRMALSCEKKTYSLCSSLQELLSHFTAYQFA